MNNRDLEKIIKQIQRHQGTLLSILNLRGTKLGGIITLIITGLGIFFTSQNHGSSSPNTNNAPITAEKNTMIPCILERIIDGDTVVAECGGANTRIRLAKIDAPEMRQKPVGQKSKDFLEEILPQHFTLHYEGKDFYQRSLGVLYNNQENINLRMIKDGYAFAYEAKNTPKLYREAQMIAESQEVGLWGKYPDKMKSPKEWRKYNK